MKYTGKTDDTYIKHELFIYAQKNTFYFYFEHSKVVIESNSASANLEKNIYKSLKF